jgi:ribosomal protein S18 acetylase RimI-like enzyme
MLQATPGIERIESQLLMFPEGALHTPFLARGFQSYPRLFMGCSLSSLSPTAARGERRLPEGLRLVPWHEDMYQPAGELIHRAYQGHVDSRINDQYRSVHGSLRFLHNIVRFPGCGTFDAANSWALRDDRSRQLQGLLLSSAVRDDVGHITQLCIAPHLRGFGLGRALLHRCIAEFRRRHFESLSLTVTESNTEALALYQDFGFTSRHRFEAMVWNDN